MADVVGIAAHAKANVFLRVLSREDTGYHGIETAFTLLDFSDGITVRRAAAGVALDVTGPDTGPATENLAYRAAELVLAATGNRFGVEIAIQKRIPVRAGLGGGSSDGAATLHAVNRLAENAVPHHEILQLAARLGADVPFLASGASMAVGWNRGERLFRIPPPPPAPALIVLPGPGISTSDAYRALDRHPAQRGGRGSVLLDIEAFSHWGGIARLGGNDFESVVFGERPDVRDLYERVAETHPLLARMTGSGSAILAVYRSDSERDDARTMIGGKAERVIATTTRAQPAPSPTTEMSSWPLGGTGGAS